MSNDLIMRLRALDLVEKLPGSSDDVSATCLAEWQESGIAFVSTNPDYERQYYRAMRELLSCVKQTGEFGAILQEGGIYFGCWLESTGTISAELVSRFLPGVAQRTVEGFARAQRDDGLFPYKLTADGAVFNQIQLVSPLARTVWNHYLLNGRDRVFLREMYAALTAYDAWIAKYRDTRATGAVEAFCCYDTGHDLSARFWHVPDTPYMNDPTRCDPASPLVPFIAPDLTASIACQRSYLARIAEELGEGGDPWIDRFRRSVAALYDRCFDPEDKFFYDSDRHGRPVKVQSDVLLRVLASEIGDDDFFAASLERYLLNTGKFFARFPFTSIAMNDPRFDPNSGYNTWCGTSNLLSLIRAPHAFEAHHRHVELGFALQPALWALFRMEHFAQTINPFTGEAGFTESYSPAMLGLLDFVERLFGILPRPEGTLWFTGLAPASVAHRQVSIETGYARNIDRSRFELVNSENESVVYKDGALLYRFPKGIRLVTDRAGDLVSLIGMSVAPVSGTVSWSGGSLDVAIGPNQQLDFYDGGLVEVWPSGYVPVSF